MAIKVPKLPAGYKIHERGSGYVIIALTDASQMTSEAPPALDIDGYYYVRGSLEAIPAELAGDVFSMRRYDLSNNANRLGMGTLSRQPINHDAAEFPGAPTIGDAINAAMMGQPPDVNIGFTPTAAWCDQPLSGQPVDTAPAGNKMAINKCAACDGHHENLDVHQYQTPQPPWTHWYLCPTLGDPCPVSLAAMNKGPGMELDGAVCQALAQAQAAGRWLAAVFWIDAEQMIRYARTTMKFPTGDFPKVIKQLKEDFEQETGPSQPEEMAAAGPLEPLRSIYGDGPKPLD